MEHINRIRQLFEQATIITSSIRVGHYWYPQILMVSKYFYKNDIFLACKQKTKKIESAIFFLKKNEF